MKRAGALLFISLIILQGEFAGAAALWKNPASFTAQQWAEEFTLANRLPLARRITLWADLAAIGARYKLGPLGEGPGHMPDPGPLYDFKRVDCLTYVEQVYALALSRNHSQFLHMLQHIRYRNGQINYRWRNHYTVADWLPANAWFIHDVTDSVGAGHTQSMTKTISRATFFAENGLEQYGNIPAEQCTTSYIPRNSAAQVAGKLHTGDMVIFVISTPGIISGHVGLIRVEDGVVYVQHASLTAKKVVKVPLIRYLHDAPAHFVGFKIARVNEQVSLPAP